MTTEIELANDLTPAAAAMLGQPMVGTAAAALDMLRQQTEVMSAAHQLAKVLAGTAMVPAAYRGKPDDAAAAILYGAELGLNPIQSLQQVFPVHGQPSIYARTMAALLRTRGYKFRTENSTDESVTVTGTAPDGETETSTWTIERARKAGYTSNKKYETDPQAMLYAKATAEVCRKLAPDVLLGIAHTREELELEPAPVHVTSERVDAGARPDAATLLRQASTEAKEVAATREPDPAEEKPARQRRGRAKTEPEKAEAATPQPGGITPFQLGSARQLLVNLGADTPEKRLAYYRTYFDRPELADPRELTEAEGVDVLAELERQLAAEQQGAEQADGGAQA